METCVEAPQIQATPQPQFLTFKTPVLIAFDLKKR